MGSRGSACWSPTRSATRWSWPIRSWCSRTGGWCSRARRTRSRLRLRPRTSRPCSPGIGCDLWTPSTTLALADERSPSQAPARTRCAPRHRGVPDDRAAPRRVAVAWARPRRADGRLPGAAGLQCARRRRGAGVRDPGGDRRELAGQQARATRPDPGAARDRDPGLRLPAQRADTQLVLLAELVRAAPDGPRHAADARAAAAADRGVARARARDPGRDRLAAGRARGAAAARQPVHGRALPDLAAELDGPAHRGRRGAISDLSMVLVLPGRARVRALDRRGSATPRGDAGRLDAGDRAARDHVALAAAGHAGQRARAHDRADGAVLSSLANLDGAAARGGAARDRGGDGLGPLAA